MFKNNEVAVIGGAGHIGLPFALFLAERGFKVNAIDKNLNLLEDLKLGKFPYNEKGADTLFQKSSIRNQINFTSDYSVISQCELIIVTLGTPVDEYQNSRKEIFEKWLDEVKIYLKDQQHIILRSTVTPSTTNWLKNEIKKITNKRITVSFCPERIVQGNALEELASLPQIIGVDDSESKNICNNFFKSLGIQTIIPVSTIEAEFAKLITNSYRYINFSIANEFYVLADKLNLSYHKILKVLKTEYPRADSIPAAGFTGGPCLYKDTAQLNSHFNYEFKLGQAAMKSNESLPLYLAEKIKSILLKGEENLVGVLGLTFKPNNEDIRDSLVFKLLKRLRDFEIEILTHDPYFTHSKYGTDLKTLLSKSNLIVIGTPHDEYLKIDFSGKRLIDVWDKF